MADYYYQHNDRKTLHGRYLTYHNNGRIKDSMHYVMGSRQGSHIAWNDKGSKILQFQYFNDKPVDSCFTWDDEGRQARLQVTDSLGNGAAQVRYSNGKMKETGRLDSGRRNGLWKVMTEEGLPMMELNYVSDSLTQTRCIDADGKILPGNCIYESLPEFPGGNLGWRTFLEKNLVYPRQAINLDIQGVVKVQFVVNKDGSIDDLRIISSPHPSLSEEVLRLMNKSPQWIPAIQLNKPVKSMYIQSVLFRLS
jgi:TonB family protein